MKPELPWHSRFDLLGVTFLIFLVSAFSALPSIEGSDGILIIWETSPGLPLSFFTRLVHSRPYLSGLLETVQIALVSTLLAIALSFVISLGASRNIAPSWVLWPTRMLLNIIRTIPACSGHWWRW